MSMENSNVKLQVGDLCYFKEAQKEQSDYVLRTSATFQVINTDDSTGTVDIQATNILGIDHKSPIIEKVQMDKLVKIERKNAKTIEHKTCKITHEDNNKKSLPNIIGIYGLPSVGKDTVGDMINAILSNSRKEAEDIVALRRKTGMLLDSSSKSLYEIKQFTAPIKEIVSILYNIPLENLYNRETKTNETRRLEIEIKTRLRDLDSHIFVNKLFKHYKAVGVDEMGYATFDIERGAVSYIPTPLSDPEMFPKWIITDVGFQCEVNKIKELGGIIIYVDDMEWEKELREKLEKELSDGYYNCYIDNLTMITDKGGEINRRVEIKKETLKATYNADFFIENKGSLEDLEVNVRKMLEDNYFINNIRYIAGTDPALSDEPSVTTFKQSESSVPGNSVKPDWWETLTGHKPVGLREFTEQMRKFFNIYEKNKK